MSKSMIFYVWHHFIQSGLYLVEFVFMLILKSNLRGTFLKPKAEYGLDENLQ